MKYCTNMPSWTVVFILTLGTIISFPPPVFCIDAAADSKLKFVRIKDSTSTNIPPNPVISFRVINESPYQVELNANGSSDSDNAIIKYNWTIGEATTITGPVVNYNFTSEADVPVSLAVTDEAGAVAITQQTIVHPWMKAINFQPQATLVPSTFLPDSGQAFDANKGYGWTQPIFPSGTRERNNNLSPSKEYDTLIMTINTSAWEIQVTNGTFSVEVCMGDPTFPDATQGIVVEGVPFITGEKTNTTTRWITRKNSVQVSDGRLTLTFPTVGSYGQICWIKIKRLK